RTRDMRKYICLLAGLALLSACGKKKTTLTKPPAEKKESNKTNVKETPSPQTKTENKTETKTNIKMTTSPTPQIPSVVFFPKSLPRSRFAGRLLLYRVTRPRAVMRR